MKKIAIILAILVLCATSLPAMAQQEKAEKEYTHVPFSISFIPNVSIGGMMGDKVITNCSLNIIAGRYAKLRGVEYGVVLNWETEEVSGAQFSGVANFLEHGDLLGLQSAGVANFVGGKVIGGVQLAPLNFVGKSMKGFQAGTVNFIKGKAQGICQTGVVNFIGGDIVGGQIASVNFLGGDLNGAQVGNVNFAGGRMHGAQVGNVNYIGRDLNKGAQIGVVNIGGNITGAQIGVVNIAHKMRGTQIGVVNLSDEIDGAPIGVFSFVRKGQIHLDVWGSDTSAFNLGLKTGNNRVYSIFALGYQPPIGDDPARWSPGMGIGVHFPYGSKFVNIEALGFHINEDEIWTDDIHRIDKLRFIGGWDLNRNLSAFFGVTLNVFVSQYNNGDHISIASLVKYNGDKTWVRIWPGFVAGIQF